VSPEKVLLAYTAPPPPTSDEQFVKVLSIIVKFAAAYIVPPRLPSPMKVQLLIVECDVAPRKIEPPTPKSAEFLKNVVLVTCRAHETHSG
jgi:hypothetical protein